MKLKRIIVVASLIAAAVLLVDSASISYNPTPIWTVNSSTDDGYSYLYGSTVVDNSRYLAPESYIRIVEFGTSGMLHFFNWPSPTLPPYGPQCVTALPGYIFFAHNSWTGGENAGGLHRLNVNTDGSFSNLVPTARWGVMPQTDGVYDNPGGIAGDGIDSIFANCEPFFADWGDSHGINVLRKYKVTNSANSFSVSKDWETTIPDPEGNIMLTCPGYWPGDGGKVYVADGYFLISAVGEPTGPLGGVGVYEFDADTGNYRHIVDRPAAPRDGSGNFIDPLDNARLRASSVYRYGNYLFVTGYGYTDVFRYDSSVWTLQTSWKHRTSLNPDGSTWFSTDFVGPPWGIGVMGTGNQTNGRPTNFWINHRSDTDNGCVSYLPVSENSITATVDLGPTSADITTVPITVELRTEAGYILSTETLYLDSTGRFTLNNVFAGTYKMAVKAPHYLVKTVDITVTEDD